jgi:hypothetical protein
MHRTGWGLAILGILLLAGPSGAADKDTYQPPQLAKRNWWWPFDGSWLTGSTRTLTDKPAMAEKPRKVENPIQAPAPSPETQEKGVSMSREQAKFIRRQQVCDRLRDIAQETGNFELEKQAQLLEQRSWYVYEQKTQARMPTLTPLETTAAAKKLMQDEPVARTIPSDRPVRSVSTRTGGKLDREED